MFINRRVALGSMLASASGRLAAQAGWPTARPIRIVVPFAVGGATDVAARVLGQAPSESLKTSIVVDNKPGAHGFVGISEVGSGRPPTATRC